MRPIAAVPPRESAEARVWPERFPELAPHVRVPVRYTMAEFERWWISGDGVLARTKALFRASPRVVVRSEPFAGHNISLGWAARPYHLGVLAFAESCILQAG
jgi:hypothetical protein